jgi:hypothetical protein
MTNQEIINELHQKWQGKTAIEIASDVDVIFGGLLTIIPEPEHLQIGVELENIGILVNHNQNEVTQSSGICRRKKNPNNQ